MYPLTVPQICDLTGGTPVGHLNLSAVIDGCVIDSRHVEKGDAFFALPGSHHHGVQFATNALRDGADLVVTDDSTGRLQIPTPVCAGL